MGEIFILAHPWVEDSASGWYIPMTMKKLQKMRDAGIQIGNCGPSGYPETTLRSSDLVTIMQRAETDDALIMQQAETNNDSKFPPSS